ncbi:MAG: tetratricopeptide repeat protein, partial [Psychrosphaera sp.]|nr:tetratricopeptide repeat protein [Psychrosphaera sp.]
SEVEQQLIAVFSVLPAEPIEYRYVEALLTEFADLDDTLDALQQQGWLDFNSEDKTFKCSPVVQQVVRVQTEDDSYQTLLIDQLNHFLKYQPGTGHLVNSEYQDATLFTRFAENCLKLVEEPSHASSILYERTGRYYETYGDLAKALVFYQEKSQVAEKLLKSDPANPHYKNSLAISYLKLGNTYKAKGNLDKALESYEKFTELEEQLHHEHPQNMDYKNGLAVAYCMMGNTHNSEGDWDKALGFYEQNSALQEQLHVDHPQNIEFENNFAISYGKLGEVHSAKGDLKKALEFYELYSELNEQLNQNYPQHVGFKNGLAISYSKLGQTYSANGDLHKALEFNEKFAALQKQLHHDHPLHIGFKNDLALSLYILGGYYQIHDYNKIRARDYFKQAQKIWLEINRDCPGYADFQRHLEVVTKDLANLENS